VAPGEVPRSGTSQSVLQTPGAGGEGWSRRPRRGNGQGCPFLFARARRPCRKARPPLTDWLGAAQPAPSGGAFSFGYFSLGKQRKVTRAAAAARKPAAGEPGRENATTTNAKSPDDLFRSPLQGCLRAFRTLRAYPAYAGDDKPDAERRKRALGKPDHDNTTTTQINKRRGAKHRASTRLTTSPTTSSPASADPPQTSECHRRACPWPWRLRCGPSGTALR